MKTDTEYRAGINCAMNALGYIDEALLVSRGSQDGHAIKALLENASHNLEHACLDSDEWQIALVACDEASTLALGSDLEKGYASYIIEQAQRATRQAIYKAAFEWSEML